MFNEYLLNPVTSLLQNQTKTLKLPWLFTAPSRIISTFVSFISRIFIVVILDIRDLKGNKTDTDPTSRVYRLIGHSDK